MDLTCPGSSLPEVGRYGDRKEEQEEGRELCGGPETTILGSFGENHTIGRMVLPAA